MKVTSMFTCALLGAVLLTLGGCCGQAEMQRKVKRAEAPANLDGIRTAELAYQAMWDTYTAAGWTPSEIPGENPAPFEGGDTAAFNALGWMPFGDVYCRYRVIHEAGEDPSSGSFEAQVECDIDGDGKVARYVATPDQKATLQTDEDEF